MRVNLSSERGLHLIIYALAAAPLLSAAAGYVGEELKGCVTCRIALTILSLQHSEAACRYLQ